MTSSQRTEFLEILDALLEGRASSAELAQLEQFVLTDQSARSLYIQALELHGMLHWESSGLTPTTPGRGAARRLKRRHGWSIAAIAATLLLGSVWWLKPPQQQMAQAPAPMSIDNVVSPPEPAIPDVRLQSSGTGSNAMKPAPSASGEPARPDPQAASPALASTLDSDEQIVAWIDQELNQIWTDAAVTPARDARDDEWVRRVYLDLAGRIPTAAEAEAFQHDTAAGKHARLVDQLLADPAAGRQFGTVWTTLLVGRSRNSEKDRVGLLRWLQQQYAANAPWTETVSALIAAEGAAQENAPATFLLAHLNNQAVPATAIAARVLLCQQLQCAQCHRHPQEKSWDQARFWELNAFFQQTRIAEEDRPDPQSGRKQRVRKLVDSNQFGPTYFETLGGLMRIAYPRLGEVEFEAPPPKPLRAELAELLRTREREQLAAAFVNRTWAQFFGAGLTNPVDDMGPHNPPAHPELLQGLTQAFVTRDLQPRQLIRWICLSRAYRLASGADARAEGAVETVPLFAAMPVRALTAEQLFDSFQIAAGVKPLDLLRGEAQREAWLRQFFTAIDTEENSESTTLDGSLPQILMMMNGDLIARATDPQSSTVLQQALSTPQLSESDRIRQLSRSALARDPSPEELARVRQSLRRHMRQSIDHGAPQQLALHEGLRDLYWAYLNSFDFSTNR